MRSAASIGAAAAFAAAALVIQIAGASADNADGTAPQADANVQRTAQNPPPARVILPAPWEQATPAPPPAVVPAGATGRR